MSTKRKSSMYKQALIGILIMSSAQPFYAAAPVVHILCAELFFRHCRPGYTQKEREAFLRGTLFPDIRYIAKIPRSKTHEKNVTLKQVVSSKSPFTAGVLFHTYVDEQRERIAQQKKIYEHLTDVPKKQRGRLLKVVEDELCYHALDPKSIRRMLLTYDSEEASFGISFITRMAWHRILRNYIRQSPLTLFNKKAAAKSSYFTMSPSMVQKSATLMKKYSKDSTVMNYVAYFLDTFEKMLQKK